MNGYHIRYEAGVYLVIDPLAERYGPTDGVRASFETWEEANWWCVSRQSPNE